MISQTLEGGKWVANRVSAGLSSCLAFYMDAGVLDSRGLQLRPLPCRRVRARILLVGTNTLDTHTSPTQIRLVGTTAVCVPKTWKTPPKGPAGRESRPRDLTPSRLQTRTKSATSRSLNRRQQHASHPRSDHHWLHLYRGVRSMDHRCYF